MEKDLHVAAGSHEAGCQQASMRLGFIFIVVSIHKPYLGAYAFHMRFCAKPFMGDHRLSCASSNCGDWDGRICHMYRSLYRCVRTPWMSQMCHTHHSIVQYMANVPQTYRRHIANDSHMMCRIHIADVSAGSQMSRRCVRYAITVSDGSQVCQMDHRCAKHITDVPDHRGCLYRRCIEHIYTYRRCDPNMGPLSNHAPHRSYRRCDPNSASICNL